MVRAVVLMQQQEKKQKRPGWGEVRREKQLAARKQMAREGQVVPLPAGQGGKMD